MSADPTTPWKSCTRPVRCEAPFRTRAAEAAGSSVRVVFDGHLIAGVDGSVVAFEFAGGTTAP